MGVLGYANTGVCALHARSVGVVRYANTVVSAVNARSVDGLAVCLSTGASFSAQWLHKQLDRLHESVNAIMIRMVVPPSNKN